MVGVDALRRLPDLVTRLGGDANALLAKVQIDPILLENRLAVIPYRSLVLLLERAAAELECRDFGMRLASLQDGAKVLGPLEVVMRNSATLREAFRYCAEHLHAHSTGTRIGIEEDRARRSVLLRFETRVARLPHHPQTVEHDLLLAQHGALDLSGGRVRAREVWLAHQPLSPPSAYRACFGATVRFDHGANGLVFAGRELDLPIPDADPQLYELATHFIEQRFPRGRPFLTARVRAIVERLLLAGDCTHAGVASMLGMHPRTLQRRLRAEGGSFEGIKRVVRREIALRSPKQRTPARTR
jgi:hypothetical protein